MCMHTCTYEQYVFINVYILTLALSIVSFGDGAIVTSGDGEHAFIAVSLSVGTADGIVNPRASFHAVVVCCGLKNRAGI